MRIEGLHALRAFLERYAIFLAILGFTLARTISLMLSIRKLGRNLEGFARSLGWVVKPKPFWRIDSGVNGEWNGRPTRLTYSPAGNPPTLSTTITTTLPGRFLIQARGRGKGLLARAFRPFGPPEVRLSNIEDAERFRAWSNDPLLLERVLAVPGMRQALVAAFEDLPTPSLIAIAAPTATFSLGKEKFQLTRPVQDSSSGRGIRLSPRFRFSPDLELLKTAAEQQWKVVSLAAGLG